MQGKSDARKGWLTLLAPLCLHFHFPERNKKTRVSFRV